MSTTITTDMSNQTSHQFASATEAQGARPYPPSEAHVLTIRQQPIHAKVFIGKEKERKPIDPPPIVQLVVSQNLDPIQNYMQSPYYFVTANLVDDDETPPKKDPVEVSTALGGTLVSSLHKLKDVNNQEGAYFIFGDLSAKMEGTFKLKFTLFEVRGLEVQFIKDITSEPFTVYSAKSWPGMAESTVLTRAFSDQGVRLRLRKEPRFRLNPTGPASDNYFPRRYTPRRSKSAADSRRPSGAVFPPSPGSGDRASDHHEYGPSIVKGSPSPPELSPSSRPPPMASFMSENRKREFSDGSQQSMPSDEHATKRTKAEDDPAHAAIFAQGQYVPTSPPMDSLPDQYQRAFQLSVPGQMQQPGLMRQPTYNYVPGFMGRPSYNEYAPQHRGSDSISYRSESLGVPEAHFPQGRSPNDMAMAYNQPPLQQSVLTQPFNPQMQQHMMQQQLPSRMSMYDYNSTPEAGIDPTIDPMLASQHQSLPRMQSMGPGGMPTRAPQFYNRRPPVPTIEQEMVGQESNQFHMGYGQRLGGLQPGQDGVGFRETYAASPSHHSVQSVHSVGTPGMDEMEQQGQ